MTRRTIPKAQPRPVDVLQPEPERYSVAKTKLGVLLADAAARAVLDKQFPGLSTSERFSAAGDMTLRTLRIFAPELFTPEALAAADAALSQLPTNLAGAPCAGST